MFSLRELLIWIGATAVTAATLGVVIAFYLVNHVVAPPDMRYPLARQDGLKPDQDYRKK
jgi:hypothetical protein